MSANKIFLIFTDQDTPLLIQMQFAILWNRVDYAQDIILPQLASWQVRINDEVYFSSMGYFNDILLQ